MELAENKFEPKWFENKVTGLVLHAGSEAMVEDLEKDNDFKEIADPNAKKPNNKK